MKVRSLFALLLVFLPLTTALAQLSDGKGAMTFLPKLNCSVYLPQHFKVMENGSGVIHNTTGTMVYIGKIPGEQKTTATARSSQSIRDMLVDERMTDVKFNTVERARSASSRQKGAGNEQVYQMSFKLQQVDFERINVIIPYKSDQYLVTANYFTRYKDNVKQEVNKIIESIAFKN